MKGKVVEVRIGIADNPQSVIVDLDDETDHKNLKSKLEDAIQGKNPVLWLTDRSGRDVVVASARITHAEIVPSGVHSIGFG